LPATAFAPATPKVPASVAGPACATHNGQHPNYAHAAVRRAPGQTGSGHRWGRTPTRISKATWAWRRPPGPGQSRRPDSATGIGQPRSTASHRVTREIRENARRPADLAPVTGLSAWLSCRDRTGCSVRDLRRRRGSPGASGWRDRYSM
jgi:hypothetical protein